MPYVITTTRPYRDEEAGGTEPDWCQTVVTLEEARSLVIDELPEEWREQLGGPQYHHRARSLESGGTVGPLPDGTVITVTRECEPWCERAAGHAGDCEHS